MPKIIETGRLDATSYFASFNCRQDEVLGQSQEWLSARASGLVSDKPTHTRTYVHELVHYLQYVTTPYGLFLQYCRLLQTRATIELVSILTQAGLTIRQPLLYNLPAMPATVAAEVELPLSVWLNVENLVAELNGDAATSLSLTEWFVADVHRLERGENPKRPQLFPLPQTFAYVQNRLINDFTIANIEAAENRNPLMYPNNMNTGAITAALSAIPSDYDRAVEKLPLLMAMFGGKIEPWDLESIIEGAATAAEFWLSGISYDDFHAWMTADIPAELAPYRRGLLHGIKSIRTHDIDRFLLSYMAICELALFTPSLPQHAKLRANTRDSFAQLLPTVRFSRLLSIAGEVEPMWALRDHSRYIGDLCRTLNWITPFQIVSSAVEGPHFVSEPVTFTYIQAQRYRAQRSEAFLGIERYLFDPSPAGDQWRDLFNFVIIDYADRTTYHKNKEFLESMTTRYLNMQAFQAIMLGNGLTFTAPYGKSSLENAWMAEWVRLRLESLFGGDFSAVKFV